MKTMDVFVKSLKEQLRSYWILILTITMAPFFVMVYYLINESSKPVYRILYLNLDAGISRGSTVLNHGRQLFEYTGQAVENPADFPVIIRKAETADGALNSLKNKEADILIIIPGNFSVSLEKSLETGRNVPPEIEFRGDLSDYRYIFAAVWGSEWIRMYIEKLTGLPSPFVFRETAVGRSGSFSDFDLYMPGLMILSLIMLMFSASIAIVAEVEHKTIIRFRLSGIRTIELLTGISSVQVIIGIVSLLLTFTVAYLLGFRPGGSWILMGFITVLTSVSIIAFSLILAAVTRSANDILIAGNFPLLLFMFFTGAAFPMEGRELFSLSGYPITIQGLMSPTHAVSAMKKVMIMDLGIGDIIPELMWLGILTILYFIAGTVLFNKRHMKLDGRVMH
jgi:ABC-2 type transport system permease protein